MHMQAILYGNMAFTVIFCAESLLKAIGIGPAGYLFVTERNLFIFDANIRLPGLHARHVQLPRPRLVSWFEVAVSFGALPGLFVGTASGGLLDVLRVLRLLPILRLARRVRGMRLLAEAVVIAGVVLSNALLLLAIILLVFSSAGVQLFNGECLPIITERLWLPQWGGTCSNSQTLLSQIT
jgi:hypothetical protein